MLTTDHYIVHVTHRLGLNIKSPTKRPTEQSDDSSDAKLVHGRRNRVIICAGTLIIEAR